MTQGNLGRKVFGREVLGRVESSPRRAHLKKADVNTSEKVLGRDYPQELNFSASSIPKLINNFHQGLTPQLNPEITPPKCEACPGCAEKTQNQLTPRRLLLPYRRISVFYIILTQLSHLCCLN